MKLLRDLDKDGFNVDGPLAELTALINYVTSSQMSMRDLQTHLDYCAEQLRKTNQIRFAITKWSAYIYL